MQPRWCTLFNISIFIALAALSAPCIGQRRDRGGPPPAPRDQNQMGEDNIQWEAGERGPRGRGGPSEDVIDRVLEEIKKEKPEKAKELAELREKDPEKFGEQLREHGREYFGRIIRETMEVRRKEAQEEFLQWLEKEYPNEAKELAKWRDDGDDELYGKKVELANRKYRHIYDAWRWNPEMGKILKEDLALQELRDELVVKIKAENDNSRRKGLQAQLERTVAQRFDLIVRRKQIALEQLMKRLEELQRLIEQSRNDLIKTQDKEYKEENVKKRIQELLDEPTSVPFKWD